MELDPLFRDAVNAVLERGRASAVVLQRQLGIGYARGIRILDQMTAAGLTGPDTPTGSREIRVTKDAWSAFSAP
jgi:DNA segregation ATPase FtsK/SpoIIIE-like protein